jgi:NADPH:quinone reductase-like Zn-dependent oxidoreductase
MAYGGLEPMGSYAEQAVVPAYRPIKLPDPTMSAALLLQGMTAHVLTGVMNCSFLLRVRASSSQFLQQIPLVLQKGGEGELFASHA